MTGVDSNVMTTPAPPDGGLRAWTVLAAAFLVNGLVFGIINTYGVTYVHLVKELEAANVTEASSKASLVGSVSIGVLFAMSPVAGILTDLWGIRTTAALGGLLATGGLFISSFATKYVSLLCVTYGVLFGVGASIAYTPSLVILSHYFKKYLGFANGVVATGSAVFSVLLPHPLNALLDRAGIANSLLALSGMMTLLIVCGLTLKPLAPRPPASQRAKLFNRDNWKRRKYVIWAFAIPTALFGYFVPYVHMVKFVQDRFPGEDGKNLLLCISIASGAGRLIFGFIADRPRVNKIFLQQISFFCIGVATMLLTVTSSFRVLMGLTLGMGLFDGCFISLLGPIAFDLCGQKGVSQAIGCLLGLCSIPLTVGPYIAGLLYDHLHSYQLPFLLAGLPPVVCSVLLFALRCVREDKTLDDDESKLSPLEPVTKKSNGTIKVESGQDHANSVSPASDRLLSNPE